MRNALLLIAAFVVPACGVPLQSQPDTIDPGVTPDSGFDAPTTNGVAQSVIYLVDGDGLIAVPRDASREPEEALQQLIAGPTGEEARAGLRTAIPVNSVVHDLTFTDGDATVDVSAAFAGVGGREEILAVGQVVLTLTDAGVERVTIRLEGLPVALPLPNGVLVTDPVTFADYRALVDR